MDFGLLPPEINSARMYTGPGSGPMIAAAAAWDDLAAQLHTSAASYDSVISGLTAEWQGPSSTAMATAAANVPAWMSAAAGLAEQTAQQARAATMAYESAFAATVPPPVVAANRVQLMSLIATNLLGQNTPAIAMTETEYAEMWARDAVAMYGYAVSSSATSQLTPFQSPRQVANSTGQASQGGSAGQAAATSGVGAQMASMTHQTLQGLATSSATNAADAPSATTAGPSLSEFLVGPYNPLKLYEPFGGNFDFGFQNLVGTLSRQNLQLAYDGAVSRTAAGLGPAVKYVDGEPVLASAGQSASVGRLSVPPSWVSAAPAVRPVAFVVPQADPAAAAAAITGEGQGGAWSNAALSGVAGRAIAGTDATATRAVGGTGKTVAGEATTAMIIVIPEDD